MITVFSAKKIITMDPNCPEATHVAVLDGRVLAVGDEGCANGWGDYHIDNRFADKVLMPGLIEAHAHVMAGGIWRYCYLGHFDRVDPQNKVWSGVNTTSEILQRLHSVAAEKSNGPVIGWGYDPSFVEGPELTRQLLDEISENRTVVVFHSNFHVLRANTFALERAGVNKSANIDGVCCAPDGSLTGELKEFDAMGPVLKLAHLQFTDLCDEFSVRAYGQLAKNCGVTTIADLNSDLFEDEVRMLERVTAEEEFPIRYSPIMAATHADPKEVAERALAIRQRSTPKLHLGSAKLFTDGAIQGRTAKLLPPGYLSGGDHGIWNMEKEHFLRSVRTLHKAGVKTHIHANGDEATESCIKAYEAAILETPNPDLRHTLEHAQLAGIDQFKRMKALGLTVNLFANHLHYFGDVHWTSSIGPDRARRMDASRDAWQVFDGDFAIHSDAPVTPLNPLKTAWCAVNRLTTGGRQLGEYQKLTVQEALHCITMGAAYVLKMDNLVGSIKCGKYADFCVLDDDPLEVGELDFADIPIVSTVLSGKEMH